MIAVIQSQKGCQLKNDYILIVKKTKTYAVSGSASNDVAVRSVEERK